MEKRMGFFGHSNKRSRQAKSSTRPVMSPITARAREASLTPSSVPDAHERVRAMAAEVRSEIDVMVEEERREIERLVRQVVQEELKTFLEKEKGRAKGKPATEDQHRSSTPKKAPQKKRKA